MRYEYSSLTMIPSGVLHNVPHMSQSRVNLFTTCEITASMLTLDLVIFQTTWSVLKTLLGPTIFFAILATVLKGWKIFEATRQTMREATTNVLLYIIDTVFILPLIVVVIVAVKSGVIFLACRLVAEEVWEGMPGWLAGTLVVFCGDFVGYWRHRYEHTSLIWPTHAIHHSDTAMSWLTLFRFHPLNRLITAVIDTTFLAVLGFPDWTLVLNNWVRHYYGMFIHADVPWMYGVCGYVFVSPVMHRWHHVCESSGSGCNFATVFSIFDRVFGTLYVPGRCTVPLGVREDVGRGIGGQLVYPFVAWARAGAQWLVAGNGTSENPRELKKSSNAP
jgi:sterol desaturase/sphingolipid hydroxylase (fatty acid hydroxylase superfamily)